MHLRCCKEMNKKVEMISFAINFMCTISKYKVYILKHFLTLWYTLKHKYVLSQIIFFYIVGFYVLQIYFHMLKLVNKK